MPFCVPTTAVSGPRTGLSCGSELRQAVGFYAEEDDIDWADSFEVLGNFWMRFEIAVDTFHAYAMLLHGA